MKNKLWILLILIILVGLGSFLYFNNSNTQNNNNNYNSSKASTNTNYNEQNTNSSNNTASNNTIDNRSNNSNIVSENNNNEQQNQENTPNEQNNDTNTNQSQTEEEIATFSTKIYSTNDAARQKNISITCSALNDTIVPKGATFSFCNTVGPATSAKGYEKADIFDKDGNKKKGLGGGNCQISTTLYNALLTVPELKITERHEHSNKVPYIQNGKDAAVAYGSYDLKFINNTGSNIKIKASATTDSVTTSILKMGN